MPAPGPARCRCQCPRSLAFWKTVFLQDPISFVSHKKSRGGERLGEVLAAACRQQMSAGWDFFLFFLLLTQEGFARGSSCWVHSGNKTEKIAKNQNHQKQETKKWLKLEASKVRMDLS